MEVSNVVRYFITTSCKRVVRVREEPLAKGRNEAIKLLALMGLSCGWDEIYQGQLLLRGLESMLKGKKGGN